MRKAPQYGMLQVYYSDKRGDEMEKIALIPAYCPGDRLLPLLDALSQRGFSVIVIDDGSGRDYDAVFEQARAFADVERYLPNRGKGEALRLGMRLIRERFQPPYTVVTADADGQHRVGDIVKVWETAAQHPESLALGKRLLDQSAPLKSRVGNGISRALYRLTTGRKIYETQTGLRAFSDKLLPRFLRLPGHRYEFEIDMILNASDLDIIETEIETVYFDNNAASHFRPFRDTVSLDKEFLRYQLPSLISGMVNLLLFVWWTAATGTWLLPSVGARCVSLLLKCILHKTICFSEKPTLGRFLISSAIILIADTAATGGLIAIGVNAIAAKLISGLLMTALSAVLRGIYGKIRFAGKRNTTNPS